jgi:hypothetical protein
MAALRASAEFRASGSGVEGVAPDAVKHSLASLEFEAAMVPAIIVKPQPEEDHAHEDAVDHNDSGEVEHSDTP